MVMRNTAQYKLKENLARIMITSKQTYLILLDFSKTFDKVNHLKSFYELQIHLVQGKTLVLIESFLVAMVLDGEASSEHPVSSVVPRGMCWVKYCFWCISTICQMIYIPRFDYTWMTQQYI